MIVCRGKKKKALYCLTLADFDCGGCSSIQSCRCEPAAPETEMQHFCTTSCEPSSFCFFPLSG